MSRNAKYLLAVCCVVATAVALRVTDQIVVLPQVVMLTVRPLLYIGLYLVWGLSVGARIVQPKVRRYLLTVAALVILWWMLRVARYNFAYGLDDISRHLWYAYYIPMLLIPQVSLVAALSFDESSLHAARYRVEVTALFTISCALIFLVVTNDLHGLAFSFPQNVPGQAYGQGDGQGDVYTYGPVYYAAVCWMVGCGLAMIGVLFARVRQVRSVKHYWLPFLFPAAAVVYTALFVLGVPVAKIVFADVTAALCLTFVGCLECCIQCGFIRANIRYGELFSASSLGAQIVDGEGTVRYRTRNAAVLKPATLRAALSGTVFLEGRTRVQSAPLAGGAVIWQEDVADILSAIKQLEENGRELSESVALERKNSETALAARAMQEKARLYDLLQAQVSPSIALMNDILERAQGTADPPQRRKLLAQAVVLGAYVKRRGNLALLGEVAPTLDSGELQLSLDELARDLRRAGVDCAAAVPSGCRMPVEDAVRAFDVIGQVIGESLDCLESLLVQCRATASDEMVMRVETGLRGMLAADAEAPPPAGHAAAPAGQAAAPVGQAAAPVGQAAASAERAAVPAEQPAERRDVALRVLPGGEGPC